MKTPEIKQCPCCEARTSDARAVCIQALHEDEKLGYAILHWRCRSCGCEWEHGQFTESRPKGTP